MYWRNRRSIIQENAHKGHVKNQLQEEYSLPVAFLQATEAIAARESKENLTASNPQFVIGAAIAPVLDALTEDLQAMEANGLVKAEHY